MSIVQLSKELNEIIQHAIKNKAVLKSSKDFEIYELQGCPFSLLLFKKGKDFNIQSYQKQPLMFPVEIHGRQGYLWVAKDPSSFSIE